MTIVGIIVYTAALVAWLATSGVRERAADMGENVRDRRLVEGVFLVLAVASAGITLWLLLSALDWI